MSQPESRQTAAAAIAGGAALLLWPALLNGYPLVFSDTGAFLAQTLLGLVVWDKPYVFGPLLHAFHWRASLWLPAVAQGLLLSWLIWLVQRVLRGRAGLRRIAFIPERQSAVAVCLQSRFTLPEVHACPRSALGAHLLLCAGLAALTAAPWFTALLMPDILAPALVLAVFLLGFGGDRLAPAERCGLGLVAMLAVAAHLSHLPVAVALLLPVALLRRRWPPVLAAATPLAGALLLLLGTNWVGHGRLALSPYGAVFALARLVADGPAARTIEARCPGAGWHLCRWAGRLPVDSDVFLWSGDGPVWAPRLDGARPGGPISLAPEAGEIIRQTLWREPLGVLRSGVANTLRQLGMAGVGDVLGPEHLEATVGLRLAQGFPAAEQERFAQSLQARGLLPAAAAPFLWPHRAVLLLGTLATLLAGWRAARAGDTRRLGLVLCVLAGLVANAAATGALSGPHDRYQARIAWLLPLAGLLAWPRFRPRPQHGSAIRAKTGPGPQIRNDPAASA
ncbi:hypothetical protein [Siccirubricoccus sp. G192]|uniref:hypothetical protein n=1 Tax=Siccirubricoccus sp. G192 TaxID=2849651 RepID=UPI001C2BF4C8|nr:hypothetical protein [Siccirubricoccus sp. G192]MBV1797180.1 hypothetical protein [Siccirubricoccus sp. G192]